MPSAVNPKKLLIVDDSDSDRASYIRYLATDKQQPYCVLEATTLEAGLALWQTQSPDVVMLDLHLPDGDGLEFLHTVRQNTDLSTVPVIVLTGLTDLRLAVESLKLGATDYLVKSDLNREALVDVLQQACDRCTLTRQLRQAQQRETMMASIALRIREYFTLDDILPAVVQEVRQFLAADRVLIYQFNPDMSGSIVAESVTPPWTSGLSVEIVDTCFQSNLGGGYRQGKVFVCDDVATVKLSDCHRDLLAQFQVQANLVVPILLVNSGTDLWGLLIVHQCQAPRQWAVRDVELLQQLAVQVAIAIQQATLYQELQAVNATLVSQVQIRSQELAASEATQRAIIKAIPDLLIRVNAEGYFLEMLSGQAVKRVLLPPDPTVRYTAYDLLPPPLAAHRLEAIHQAFATQTVQTYEQQLEIDGELRWEEVRISPVDEQEVLVIIRDITDRKQAEIDLRYSEANNRAILTAIPDLLVRVNAAGEYLEFITPRDFNLFSAEQLGKSIRESLPPAIAEQQMLAIQRAIATQHLQVHEQAIPVGDRTQYEEVRTIRSGEDDVLLIIRDVSDRKQAELALQRLNQELEAKVVERTIQLERLSERLSLALYAGGIGCWDWEVQTDSGVWDQRQYILHGLPYMPNTMPTYDQWLDTLHPDDRQSVQDCIQQAIAGQTSYDTEYRVIHPDGSIHILKAIGMVIWNAQGNPQRMIGVNFDISDRKQAELQLKQTNIDLMRITRLKDDFLANMSHELRTPLNAILGMAEVLQDKLFGDINDSQSASLSTIERSANHLLSLINDILDVAKIESGKLELELTPTAIAALCKTSLNFVKPQALKKRIQLSIQLPSSPIPDLLLDERRICQALINLLTNAVKFTSDGGQVTLAVSTPASSSRPLTETPTAGDYLQISVTDTGIGISAANIQQLFQPFVQIDSALNRKYEGTGLGLVLVKQVVELHGGRVDLTSQEGVGSCFTLSLPYTPVITPPAITPTSADVASSTTAMQTTPAILLVEDNEANISTMSAYLTAKGYELLVARDGITAISLTQMHHPDLILMDIQMPEMDGLVAIQQIRALPNCATIPIIAVTALTKDADRDLCLAAGATDYIPKPVKLKQLVMVMQQCLQRR